MTTTRIENFEGFLSPLDKHLRFYREQRLSTIPIPYGQKKASIKWQVYQNHLPTDAEIDKWFSNNRSNLAIVCGKVSGNLTVLDFDSQENFYELATIIKEKTGVDDILDFTLVVKTDRGFHIYLRTKDTTKTQKFPKLEIRGEGSYVLVPPSLHPNGTLYEFLNPNTPIALADTLVDIGIDLEQTPLDELPRNQPNWVTQALQGVSEGDRNDTCLRLAGYFKNKHPQDITETLLLNWNSKNKPPLPEKEILTTISSVYRYDGSYPNADKEYIYKSNPPKKDASSYDLGQACDKSVTSLGQVRGYGDLSKVFDAWCCDNLGTTFGRDDVAAELGCDPRDESLRRLIFRRLKETKIRRYGRYKDMYEVVNRTFGVTPLNLKRKQGLDIYLPLNAHQLIKVMPRTVIVVGGEVSSGKTHFAYGVCENNVANWPCYHFYNDMGEAKHNINLEDYPGLVEAHSKTYFPSQQEDYDFADVIQPDAINVIDYLTLTIIGDYFNIDKEINRLFTPLDRGIVVVMLQKPEGRDDPYGKGLSKLAAATVITLSISEQKGEAVYGKAKITKCKDWQTAVNPVNMGVTYYTGGKHGKLLSGDEWYRLPSK